MCWVKGLGDPNVLVCCGLTAHARKVSAYMFFLFAVVFGIGAFMMRDYALATDLLPHMILFWYCFGSVLLLIVNYLGCVCCSKALLLPGFLVHGSLVIILGILTVELGLAVVFPYRNTPSPLLGNYLSVHRYLQVNWLMQLIGGLLTLNLFFLTQLPTTAFISQLKIWREITIFEEYEKSPRVTISNHLEEEKSPLSPDLIPNV